MVFFETCGPSEVLVVSGACNSTPKYITGGRAFVWPLVQQADRLSLNTMTLEIKSDGVYTELGVSISVTGIAQVRIHGRNDEMLQAACQQFLGKTEGEIQKIAHETLEGHQRAIMGNMTVEEIYQDRQKFSQGVFEVASSDLVNMGITVVSYTITDVSDDQGYMHALGMGRTAQVVRDARIGEAEATKDSEIKKSLAQEAEMKAKYTNDIAIAQSQRDFELKKAEYDIEVNTKKAESDLAYQLQAAKTNQKIKEQQMQVKVVERTQQIALEEQEILRKEKELESRIQKPADAYKFKIERLAEAERNRTVLEAQAEAEAIQVKGEAEAYAIEAKAKAEAEQMAKKADAWKEYQDAAMVDMMLETLPKVVAEVAAPLSKANKITMVSQGPGDIGAAKLTGEVMSIVNQLPSAVRELTGVDISQAMKSAQRAK